MGRQWLHAKRAIVNLKKGQTVGKLVKEITVAAKLGGGDPAGNARLHAVLEKARKANVTREAIERAIAKGTGSGGDKSSLDHVVYEGYAPHGVAVLVETATDNPTRTVASVRNILSKHGGNLASNGSVSFLFRRMGVFRLNPAGIDQDDLELDLIDHGLDEMGESTGEHGEPQLVVRCAFEDFGQLQKRLEERKIVPVSAEQEYV